MELSTMELSTMEIINKENNNKELTHYQKYKETISRGSRNFYKRHKQEILKERKEAYHNCSEQEKQEKLEYQRLYHIRNKARNNRNRTNRERLKREVDRLKTISPCLFT